ncbi:MAG: flagellar biosynthesis protein FlhB [Oscillospiraceae bacterium]
MGERTEKASPKKRSDERKKGNTFQSKDVISVASILIMVLFLQYYFPIIYDTVKKELRVIMGYMATETQITQSLTTQIFKDFAINSVIAIFPVAFMAIFIAVITTGIQTRFIFSMGALKPKFSKLNPIKGIANLFSLKSVVELIKNILKITIVAYLLYDFISKQFTSFIKSLDMGITQGVMLLFNSLVEMSMKIVLVFLALAAFDYLYQWWDYEKNMKMSKQEVKEEYKQTEGDPQIKSKIKDKQRKMSQERMMQAVPTADVIIRNPTHFAVALKYDIDNDYAPIVVAKGQDNIALKIVEIGEKNGVYTIENRPLARALYAQTEINDAIPFEHFAAVAEILALVYKMKGNLQ